MLDTTTTFEKFPSHIVVIKAKAIRTETTYFLKVAFQISKDFPRKNTLSTLSTQVMKFVKTELADITIRGRIGIFEEIDKEKAVFLKQFPLVNENHPVQKTKEYMKNKKIY